MNEFRSEVGFPTFYSLLFVFLVNKAVPTKAKANKSKPQKLVCRVSVKINVRKKKLTVIKKLNISLPSFVYFMASANELQS